MPTDMTTVATTLTAFVTHHYKGVSMTICVLLLLCTNADKGPNFQHASVFHVFLNVDCRYYFSFLCFSFVVHLAARKLNVGNEKAHTDRQP